MELDDYIKLTQGNFSFRKVEGKTMKIAPFIGIKVCNKNSEKNILQMDRRNEFVLGVINKKNKVIFSYNLISPITLSKFWWGMKILQEIPNIDGLTPYKCWSISDRETIHENDLDKFNKLAKVLGGEKKLNELRNKTLSKEIPEEILQKILTILKKNEMKVDQKDLKKIRRARNQVKLSFNNDISSTGVT